MTQDLPRILDEHAAACGGECALLTVLATKGSAYRRAGARAIVCRDGRVFGAISGGCVEADLVTRALRVIERGMPETATYTPAAADPLFGLGTGCEGEVTVAIEPLHADLQASLSRSARSLSLFLFGASPAAEALAKFGQQLGWVVSLADHRPAVREDQRFSSVDRLEIAPADELVGKFEYPSPSAAVVMTHHYLRDLEIVRQLLDRRLDYVGLVGARSRAEKIASDLRGRGASSSAIASLRAPAGLDLGADAPAEIALSIVAEIQAVLRRATAGALRDRRGKIHDEADENAIVILAAGGSKRLGRPKQLVEIEGRSLVRAAAERALETTTRVYVVVGDAALRVRDELSGLPVEIVQNDAWSEGIASSIRVGVNAVEERPTETVTLMLCDQPDVTSDALRRLTAAYRSTRASVVASRYPEGPGVPALFHSALFPALKLMQGDAGARQIIRHLDRDVVTIPFDAPGDVDTEADVARLGRA